MKFLKIDTYNENLNEAIELTEVDKKIFEFCCNNNGQDIECELCGEFYENGYISEEMDNENFGSIVLTQSFDDPDSEDYIMIKSLKSCPCCKENKSWFYLFILKEWER